MNLPSHFDEPSAQELDRVKDHINAIGGSVYRVIDRVTKRKIPFYRVLVSGGRRIVELLPDIPFQFGLGAIEYNKMVDAQLIGIDKCSTLVDLDLSESAVTDEGKAHLVSLPKLTSLSLDWTNVSSQGLRLLGQIPSLACLTLRFTNIKSEGLMALASFHALASLDLTTLEVNEAVIGVLSRNMRLETLHFSTDLSDAATEMLHGLKYLKSLHLSGPELSARQYESLSRLKVPEIHLRANEISEEGMRQLAILKQLTTLYAHKCPVTDEGLKHIENLECLRVLELPATDVTDAGMKHVAKLQGLSSLMLCRTEITDIGLKEIAKLHHLESLDLRYTNITDAGLMELKCMCELNSLKIKSASITEYGVRALQSALPNCQISARYNV